MDRGIDGRYTCLEDKRGTSINRPGCPKRTKVAQSINQSIGVIHDLSFRLLGNSHTESPAALRIASPDAGSIHVQSPDPQPPRPLSHSPHSHSPPRHLLRAQKPLPLLVLSFGSRTFSPGGRWRKRRETERDDAQFLWWRWFLFLPAAAAPFAWPHRLRTFRCGSAHGTKRRTRPLHRCNPHRHTPLPLLLFLLCHLCRRCGCCGSRSCRCLASLPIVALRSAERPAAPGCS